MKKFALITEKVNSSTPGQIDTIVLRIGGKPIGKTFKPIARHIKKTERGAIAPR